MKNLKAIAAMLLGSLLLGCGCSKDGLTPKTQKGANTLSCKVNGKAFTAKPMWANGGTCVHAYYHDNIVFINGSGPGIYDEFDIIEFSLENPAMGKEYIITEKKLLEGKPISCGYTGDNHYNGYGPAYFKITYFDEKIVAGEFSFNGISDENSSKIISVTSGRFDIKITPY